MKGSPTMSLFDSSTKSARFAAVGDHVTGIVSAVPYERQKTKFGTNQPDFYDNGDPKMQILVPLSTEERDTAEDDGERILYVSSHNMRRAISSAIRDAGALDLEVGGKLTVTFTGFDPNSKNPANPAKLYTAAYQVAAVVGPDVSNRVLAGGGVDGPADVGKARELIALGLTDEQVASITGVRADSLSVMREALG